jgi:hypothetical protein
MRKARKIWAAFLALMIALALVGGNIAAAQENTPAGKAEPAPTSQKVTEESKQADEADEETTGEDKPAPETQADQPELDLPPGALLPDLRTLPFDDLRLIVNVETGARTLRFSNRIVNAGLGPVELRGEREGNSGAFSVWQVIYGGEEPARVPVEGNFYYNQQHTHYHWDGFAAYEIWTVETSGSLSRAVLENDKVGFCLFDTRPVSSSWLDQNVEEELSIPLRRVYWNCNFNRQGISPGWVDVYRHNIAGQAIDVSALDDGVYALRAVVDPYGALVETDPTNNEALAYFALLGNDLHVLGEEFSLLEYFALLVDEGKIQIYETGKVLVEETVEE